MNELIPIGNTIIAVADDEYVSAYQSGYLTYKLDYGKKTLSDMDIYNFFASVIPSVRNSGRYNAGFVTGWIAALTEVDISLNHKHIHAMHTAQSSECIRQCKRLYKKACSVHEKHRNNKRSSGASSAAVRAAYAATLVV